MNQVLTSQALLKQRDLLSHKLFIHHKFFSGLLKLLMTQFSIMKVHLLHTTLSYGQPRNTLSTKLNTQVSKQRKNVLYYKQFEYIVHNCEISVYYGCVPLSFVCVGDQLDLRPSIHVEDRGAGFGEVHTLGFIHHAVHRQTRVRLVVK